MPPRTVATLRNTFAFSLLTLAGAGEAATIYASGQRLTQAVPGVHDDIRENFLYHIDVTTGTATPVSPATTGLPSALGMKADGSLWGFRSGNLGTVDITTGSFSPSASGGPNATAFDFSADGTPYAVPFNDDFRTQQLFRFEQATDSWQSIGSVTAVGDAIDATRGTDPGTAEPFLIGLGVVGEAAYGIDLDTYSLIELDLASGVAGVVGEIGAVQSDWRSGFSGFSALTGVDTNADGRFDSLFGAVNFWDHDADPTTSAFRFGGLAM
ncbi:MAG: PEP-CTERM sorting domain-containing protein, partial [Gammaproteobacteria bacterium]